MIIPNHKGKSQAMSLTKLRTQANTDQCSAASKRTGTKNRLQGLPGVHPA